MNYLFSKRSVYLLSVKDKTIIFTFIRKRETVTEMGNRLSKNGKN